MPGGKPPATVSRGQRAAKRPFEGTGYGPLLHGPGEAANHLSMRRKQERVGEGTHQRLYGAGALIVMTAVREGGAGREQAPQAPYVRSYPADPA